MENEDNDKINEEKNNIRDFIFDNWTDFLASADEFEYEEILSMKEELDNWIKKIEILKLTPKKCPKCGDGEVVKIVYGEPAIDISTRPDLYFHGCDIIGEPFEWICMKCHWEWSKREEGQYNEDFDDDEED